jgi:hypothetical protein
MPCAGPATTMMTLGYDPPKRRFVGTFNDSMMTHLWVYDGALDAAGNQYCGPGLPLLTEASGVAKLTEESSASLNRGYAKSPCS